MKSYIRPAYIHQVNPISIPFNSIAIHFNLIICASVSVCVSACVSACVSGDVTINRTGNVVIVTQTFATQPATLPTPTPPSSYFFLFFTSSSSNNNKISKSITFSSMKLKPTRRRRWRRWPPTA